MSKRWLALLCALLMLVSLTPESASALPRQETPNYKVSFFYFDCFNMQDDNGKRSGYGYEMMQGIAKQMQCTFTYLGYDKSANECVDMLRSGELDIYTAARRTPEREAEFAFSTHPAITSSTCMNVKVGNTKIVAGDYATYNGIRVGLLQRHTYNGTFLAFVEEKGFDCEIKYYDTPTELTNALVEDEVDALVNSYIRIPEDEQTVEDFGETPYYLMVRKEDQALVERLDAAIDLMNVETPNWRTELYNQYYGSEEKNLEFSDDERALLAQLRQSGETIRAVMSPDANPYSWYEDGEPRGIVADLFIETAESLGLPYEIVPVASKAEYEDMVLSGDVDIWMDADSRESSRVGTLYKLTTPYLTTTMSALRLRGASEKIEDLVILTDHVAVREIISSTWPTATVTVVDSPEECKQMVLSGKADAALMKSYSAQKLARDDVQNRLRVDIVPGATLDLMMGINAQDNVLFLGLWEKTLTRVSESHSAEIVQDYLEQTTTPTMLQALFDHPIYLVVFVGSVLLLLLLVLLYTQSVKSKRAQEKISHELAIALKREEEATEAKQNFFSKMSHDIRTPLNVVLGMTQIAQKYRNDPAKLNNALNNITKEGNYLLVLINSILDVNQLEHGSIELIVEPFDLADCLKTSVEMLRPLSGKREQTLTVSCNFKEQVVRGDDNRLKQILINIISNAIKYTNVGGHIEVSLMALPDNRYRFTCKDDGIGMTESFVQHICEDYTRAEDSRVSKVQGTGLGMSVVKGFTELMGGTLTIHSKLGEGSTFIVELPFPPATEEERQSVLRPQVDEDSLSPAYFGKKVLLVEDNALNAEIAMELLQTIGLQVDWAENGEVAVERFSAAAPDTYFAIFMDMQMPVMDGVTATKVIRQSSRADRNVPIFAMTANTFASDRRDCRDAGMNGYIPKPVSVKNIEHALNTLEA